MAMIDLLGVNTNLPGFEDLKFDLNIGIDQQLTDLINNYCHSHLWVRNQKLYYLESDCKFTIAELKDSFKHDMDYRFQNDNIDIIYMVNIIKPENWEIFTESWKILTGRDLYIR